MSRTFSSYLKHWSVMYAPLGCVTKAYPMTLQQS